MSTQKYNHFVRGSLNGAAGILLSDIFVPFVPDYLIVKYSVFHQDGAQDNFYVTSDLIDYDHVLCPVDDGFYNKLDTYYDMNKPVRGRYNFYMRTLGGAPLTTYTGNLLIHLEFHKRV